MSALGVAILHHLAAFTLVAALVAEHLLFDPHASRGDRRLRVVDAIYGASAGVLLAAGLARVFYLEKGAAYYFGNPYFLAKFAAFLAIAALSIYPTLTFLKWRRDATVTAAQAWWIPKLLRAQLALVPAVIACAVLMAKGFQ